jgi:hypothetical protein
MAQRYLGADIGKVFIAFVNAPLQISAPGRSPGDGADLDLTGSVSQCLGRQPHLMSTDPAEAQKRRDEGRQDE